MSSGSTAPTLSNSRWSWFNQRVFDLPQVVRRLDIRGDQGFDVNYKDIVTAIVNHVTSFSDYYDCSVDYFATALQLYEEVLDICEFCNRLVLGNWRLDECGCATLALAAVRLTLKNSLLSFIQICRQLLTNVRTSSKFMAKLCLFMNYHNQTYLLFFVSDTEFSLENDVMSYQWLSAKREVLESMLLEKFHEANNNGNREDANIIQSHIWTLIDQPTNESDSENVIVSQLFDC